MWRKICILIFIFKLLYIDQVHCDFYTSIAGLEDLLESEIYLVETFEKYLQQVRFIKQKITGFLTEIEENYENIKENPVSYFENPVNAFRVIKRCALDWQNLVDFLLVDKNAADYAKNVSQMSSLNYAIATTEDLIGASKALARLQSTYALETADIAAGILQDYEYNSTLSAHDCFELGRSLYDGHQIQYAGQWLLESRLLLKDKSQSMELAVINNEQRFDFPFLSDVNILEHLAANMFESGNKKMAIIFNEELLKQDPTNKYGLSNKELFELEVNEERSSILMAQQQSKFTEKKPTVDTLCEAVCRGEVKQSPKEQRHLRCRYISRGVPFCHLTPFKMEELSHDPFVAFYHDAIYDSEMEKIITTAEDFIERSQIGDDDEATYSDERTSKNTWLDYADYKFLRPLKQRLQDITGLNFKYAEPLQVVNYGIGGHYMPHDDFSENAEVDYENEGNRILTALFYINDVELGGATAFPFLKLAVPPIKGSLLVWYNMHESLELDYRTRHAGCPVIKGSKWICNEWFHERGQEFTRPCSMRKNGEISLKYKDII